MANKVFLMGRLTKDPDMRGEGTNLVARYSLAVDRRFKDNDGNYQTDFINIVVFGKGAEFAEKYLKKGTKVVVTGRIQTGSYTNKEGAKIYTTDVIAEDQEFAESKSSGTQQENETVSKDDDFMNLTPEQKDSMPF